MPDHWDTRPEDLFTPPAEQPDPAREAHDDQTNQVQLKDPGGRLRVPAYVLIALAIAAAAILLVAAGLTLAPG